MKSTNRIDTTFAGLRPANKSALVPFFVAGDPDLGTTLEIMRAAADSGADMIELGVPFSDPTSDGPVLQNSSEIALAAGASLPRALDMVAKFRSTHQTPVILYGYFNPIFRYRPEVFARDAQQAGVDGVLVVDLPPEECKELVTWTKPNGIHFVFLLAPTTGPERTKMILKQASGFVYYVSLTGVTGVKTVQPEAIRATVEGLRTQTKVPIGVGFGISTKEQARATAAFADAVVVGSALMRKVDEFRATSRIVSEVAAMIGDLKEGILAARAGG